MSSGIAILGAGIFAKTAHLPALAQLGSSAPPLKAVYSRSQKSAQDLADAAASELSLNAGPDVYYDADPAKNLTALLARDDITSVILVLPITTQPAIILQALAAGKHVLSEKPVAPTVKEGLDLIAKYEKEYKNKGLIWRVAENFEAEPIFRKAGKVVREGAIGKVQMFRSVGVNWIDEKNNMYYNTPWRTVPDYQGGFLLDGGVHTIAALRTILPSRLGSLASFASLHKPNLPPHDTIHVIARSSPSDAPYTGTLDMTFASPTSTRPSQDAVVITGSQGWLTVNFKSSVLESKKVPIVVLKVVKKSTSGGEDEVEEHEGESVGVRVELNAFIKAVKGEKGGEDEGVLDIGDPLETLRDVAFIEAALKSEGQLVDLEALVSS